MECVKAMLKYFNGKTPVYIYKEGEKKAVLLPNKYWVSLSTTLINELKDKLGYENVKVVTKLL